MEKTYTIGNKTYTEYDLHQMIQFYQQQHPVNTFIGSKDVEMTILLDMSIEDLAELTQVNQYLKKLIMTDDFWCQYLLIHFKVNYKTECLHIGRYLLTNTTYQKMFTMAIKRKDVALVRFLADAGLIKVNLIQKYLDKTTYLPIIKILVLYLDDRKLKDFFRNMVNKSQYKIVDYLLSQQLIDLDYIYLAIHKKGMYEWTYTQKMNNLLKKYIPKDLKTQKSQSRARSRARSSSSSSSSSSSRSSSESPPRRKSPKRKLSPRSK